MVGEADKKRYSVWFRIIEIKMTESEWRTRQSGPGKLLCLFLCPPQIHQCELHLQTRDTC